MGIRLVDRKIGEISSDPVPSKRAFSDRAMYYSQNPNGPEADRSEIHGFTFHWNLVDDDKFPE